VNVVQHTFQFLGSELFSKVSITLRVCGWTVRKSCLLVCLL